MLQHHAHYTIILFLMHALIRTLIRLHKHAHTLFLYSCNDFYLHILTFFLICRHVLLLDTRYHRGYTSDSDVLGEDQWKWFERAVRAAIRAGGVLLIGSSIQACDS